VKNKCRRAYEWLGGFLFFKTATCLYHLGKLWPGQKAATRAARAAWRALRGREVFSSRQFPSMIATLNGGMRNT